MKLLFDQNLSRKLCGPLTEFFPDSKHVAMLGLNTATDWDIWRFAAENAYTIISKDADFRQFAFLYGPPPKVIWCRVGNASTATILKTITDHIDDIAAFETDRDAAILIITERPD